MNRILEKILVEWKKGRRQLNKKSKNIALVEKKALLRISLKFGEKAKQFKAKLSDKKLVNIDWAIIFRFGAAVKAKLCFWGVKLKHWVKISAVFLVDHGHILFKSAAFNHLRLQQLQKEDRTGESCVLSFRSYSHLKQYQKRVRIITLSSSTALTAVVILVVAQLLFFGGGSKAASYGWTQTDWSGGTDTVNFPNHANNQTNWTKEYSATSVDVSTVGEAKLQRYSN